MGHPRLIVGALTSHHNPFSILLLHRFAGYVCPDRENIRACRALGFDFSSIVIIDFSEFGNGACLIFDGSSTR